MNWAGLLNGFAIDLLDRLGYDRYCLPTNHNPITRALRDNPNFVRENEDIPGFNRANLSRAAVLCQMAVYDEHRGPEGDGEPKSLRRHWYSYYKSEFAQPLALQIGDFEVNAAGVKEMNDLAWTQRLSTTYAELVDSGDVTYRDLWIDDASRMFERFYTPLFAHSNILICVEKDSLYGDFVAAGNAIGATALYSGKGKSSKAAIEKVLREAFGWSQYNNPFSAGNPLVIVYISDYDFDGEAVIGPTFGEQARRYTNNIVEVRVGINPENVVSYGLDPTQSWYRVKVSNKGYVGWAQKKALFRAVCDQCGQEWVHTGTCEDAGDVQDLCPGCGGLPVPFGVEDEVPHGYEVEALKTRQYYPLLAAAVIEAIGFGKIVSRLRDECRPSVTSATQTVVRNALEDNWYYAALKEQLSKLEEEIAALEQAAEEVVTPLCEQHAGDFRDEGDDPAEEDFAQHVHHARRYSSAWRPFNSHHRTELLTEKVWQRYDDVVRRIQEATTPEEILGLDKRSE